MAIGTTSLFKEISGSVGPVDFRTRRNGKIEIGKKRIPANPQSTRQLEVRNAYGRLHELWQNASYIDKAQYERLGKLYNISAWNAFLLRHQSAMSAAPVASWDMVESSGLDLHDLTINDNHGTISGATWDNIGPSDLSILTFDGIDDQVNYGTPSSLSNLPNFSADAWVWLTDSSLEQSIIHAGVTLGNGTTPGFRANIKNKKFNVGLEKTTIPYFKEYFSNIALESQKWYYLCFTYENVSGKADLFHNGIFDTTGTHAGCSTGPLHKYTSHTWRLKGYTGHIGIYDYTRTPSQILQYYNNTRHLYGV